MKSLIEGICKVSSLHCCFYWLYMSPRNAVISNKEIKPAKKVGRMRVSPPKKKSRLYASPPVPVQKEALPVEFFNIQTPPAHCYLFIDIETLTTKNLDKIKITKKKKKKHADTSDTVDLDQDLEQDLPEIKEVTSSEKLAPDLERMKSL
ncbi:hypothetical protein RCL1_001759 [Eukaryota sp. TZLM3-RCL]